MLSNGCQRVCCDYLYIFVREPKHLRTSPRLVVQNARNIEDVESPTLASKMRTSNTRKKNIAKVLFPDGRKSGDKGCSDVKVQQCCGHVYGGSSSGVQLQMPYGQCTIAIDSKYTSDQPRGVHISDTEVINDLKDVDESDNVEHSVIAIIDSAINFLAKDTMAGEPPWPFFNHNRDVGELSNDGSVFLSDSTENDGSALENSWEGYEDYLIQNFVNKKNERSSIDGFLFRKGGANGITMELGQRFKDEFHFRRAVEIQAMRDGIKLCVMENTSTLISCECSNLMCDWKVSAAKVRKGNVFVLKEIIPNHTCKRHNNNFALGTMWNAAKFLHLWVENPNIDLDRLGDEIERCSGIKYPTWKVEAIDKVAKFWLRTDHSYGYEHLLHYKNEMLKVNKDNIIKIQTKTYDDLVAPIFDRMFVLFADCSHAFKTTSRRLVIVDGWEIDSPYKSVMLVAVCRDGNNAVLPIAFCEVQEENLDSWSFFLKNLYEGLRMDYMDYGKGICIMCDGDNGVDEAVSEFLPYAQYRQCCFSIYNKLMKQFPHALVYSLFWSACRSTNKAAFQHQMMLLQCHNRDCYQWLIDRGCHTWALYCMPEWAKSTDITISATEQLRIWLLKYLDMNVANRFTAITKETAKIFQKRYLAGWDWVHDSITPTTRQQITQNVIEGDGWNIHSGADPKILTVTMNGLSFVVNKELAICSCGLWQLSGIPCPHACRCIIHWAASYADFVHDFMTVEVYRSTYGPGMKELPEICKWTPQLIDIVQPPLKRLIDPMNGDDETQSHTPVIEYDNLNIPNSSSWDDSITFRASGLIHIHYIEGIPIPYLNSFKRGTPASRSPAYLQASA
ncbi:SWIM-type domain-containing protein [Citrus sinensis]|nr:SWIM-type domain-containing protein [Citrus sinensis]